ncbi:MAG: hypothetical protein KDE62_06560, partial [Calditrichaeota bacterium]|nr:hypothetical protein [Calditrichota bacterium]
MLNAFADKAAFPIEHCAFTIAHLPLIPFYQYHGFLQCFLALLIRIKDLEQANIGADAGSPALVIPTVPDKSPLAGNP